MSGRHVNPRIVSKYDGGDIVLNAAEGIVLGHGGVEVLVFEFAHGSAVHGICPVGTEMFHIELVRTLADFLVGVECYSLKWVFPT